VDKLQHLPLQSHDHGPGRISLGLATEHLDKQLANSVLL
jgi:hypothetical protein